MEKVGKVTVEVTPRLTVDNDTAWVCLGLLELYCRQNKKTIEVRHTRPVGSDGEFEVSLDFIDDNKLAEMKGAQDEKE